MNLLLLLLPTAIVVVLFALGMGIGQLVLRPWRRHFNSSLDFHCFAVGIGMGIVAHATLLLGLMGQWRPAGFLPLAIALAGAAVAGFRPLRGERPNQSLWNGPPTPVEVVTVAALAVIMVCLGLRAATPSANYDVLEYHVGAVQHWLRAGRIFPFPHLFYAALPFEVEMWYAAGCFFEGNPLLPATPKLICFAICLCNLATVYALASALCRRRTLRLLACSIFAAHPLVSIGASDALNDLGLTWFASLAFLAWLLWLAKRERVFFVLWSVFLGFTFCCKYTAAGLIILPALLILLPVAFLSPPTSGLSPLSSGLRPLASRLFHLLGDWFVAAIIIAAVFWPWALKNTRQFGNPVYPLLSGWLPSPTWSAEQTDFYMAAHGRTTPLNAAFWVAFARNLERFGPWLMLAVVAGAIWRKRDASLVALTASVVVAIFVHSFFPGNPTRFLLPLLPLAVVLAARFLEQLSDTGTPLRAAVVAPFIFWVGLGCLSAIDPPRFRDLAPKFVRVGLPIFADAPAAGDLVSYLFSRMTRLEVLEQALGPAVVESQRFINERTPPNSRIFLLYEARIGCFERQVEVGSVFDQSPLVERAFRLRTGDALLKRLRSEGFDYLYVNEFELARLIETYTPSTAWHAPSQKPTLLGPGTDIRDASKYCGLYPPYWQDPRFARCLSVIEDFVATCRRRAIYSPRADFPYGLWVAPLK